ncbi:MAG: hypothetical protein LAO77_09360 [Acidobacteriia bacterium]|nr:hypothetical protein [Terriglobia bacterium]
MRSYIRIVPIAALLLLPVSSARAQTAADPSGHWQGKIETPGMDLNIEVDLAKNGAGALIGTVAIPAEHVKGLPLAKLVVEGRTVTFGAREDQTLTGDLSDDGKTMSGTFSVAGATVPFLLTREGDAKIDPPARSAAIGKDLEGTWTTTVESTGNRVALKLTNHPDGTATGSLINLSEGGLEIPMRITQTGSSVTLETTVVAGTFSGTLNAAATELAGTWSEGPVSKPVTFHRAGAAESKK